VCLLLGAQEGKGCVCFLVLRTWTQSGCVCFSFLLLVSASRSQDVKGAQRGCVCFLVSASRSQDVDSKRVCLLLGAQDVDSKRVCLLLGAGY
jgi:hypothetical protein